MDLQFIQANNKILNTTLDQARLVCNALAQMGFTNPRLYANTVSGGGPTATYMIPETSRQRTDGDLWVDSSRNLVDMGVPSNVAIYLQLKVDQKDDYFCVGSIIREMLIYGISLRNTLQ